MIFVRDTKYGKIGAITNGPASKLKFPSTMLFDISLYLLQSQQELGSKLNKYPHKRNINLINKANKKK